MIILHSQIMMTTSEENIKLISLVKEQPILYANFKFSAAIDQQIEVLKLETWENISKSMNLETPLVIELWNEIEDKFNKELETCRKATDFQRNCSYFGNLQFLLRHYQETKMFQTDEHLEDYEFVVTNRDLECENGDIFQEISEEQFLENQSPEEATDEDFGMIVTDRLQMIRNEEDKRELKRQILKLFES